MGCFVEGLGPEYASAMDAISSSSGASFANGFPARILLPTIPVL
jgi:hypothetical protein